MASVQLSIAEPCHENWNDMLPEEKGRFCLSCQKTVVDFTQMSDRQVFDYFKNYKGSTCGQLLPAQLNREISRPKTHSIGRWKYFWQVLLPTVFAFYKADAQKTRGEVTQKVVCKTDNTKPTNLTLGKISRPVQQPPVYQIQGMISDEQHHPLASATIVSSNGNYAITDSSGEFSTHFDSKEVLTISYVGYETQQFTLDSITKLANSKIEIGIAANTITIHLPIQLKQKPVDAADAVVVIGGRVSSAFSCRMGGISVVKSQSIFSRSVLVKKDTALPKLSVFPNPIKPGQDFQLALQVKKTENLFLQITDVSGKVVYTEKFSAGGLNFTKTIGGDALLQAGIYFINILNLDNKKKKRLTSKIVVQ